MPIYDFNLNKADNLKDVQFPPKNEEGDLEHKPAIAPIKIEGAERRDDIWFEDKNVQTNNEIRDLLPQGYRTMDRGLKNYFSGIRVPTKDGFRIMQVRVSGGDKPYLIWAQDLYRGRVQLPVMSIKRDSEEFNPMKFSPAHVHYMTKRFVDKEGTKLALTYRPVPSNINYTLSVWAEHKRDLEYILYQIRTCFNPVCEFLVEDEHLRGSVFLKYNGMTTAVDDDVPADQRANKRYDFSLIMEGWLPLPEKIVPSILGRVSSLREQVSRGTGEVLEVVTGKDVLNTAQIKG